MAQVYVLWQALVLATLNVELFFQEVSSFYEYIVIKFIIMKLNVYKFIIPVTVKIEIPSCSFVSAF